MAGDKIIFYDIPSEKVGAWSPNTWKARFALNFKGIPYQTEWIEYPDIAGKLKAWGAEPTSKNPDGTPRYTLPAIFDPSTKTYVTDSTAIAEYLEKTYPDTPKLFPTGLNALQFAFIGFFYEKISPIYQFAIPKSFTILNDASQPYFRQTREAVYQKKIEEVPPTGEAREQEWGKVKAAFDAINTFYEKGKADGPYLLGKGPGYADFVVASWVIWIKTVYGASSEEWKDLSSWNSGRWASNLNDLAKYQAIH